MEWVVDGCGGLLNKDSGAFSSPEYPNYYPANVICEWKIETDPGTKVRIVIVDLDLEGGRGCVYDSFKIYGGQGNDSSGIS